ncbi:MAG: ABC transporter ATP-binding protein/permease [Oscillospiraceae bacterium]|nr:ABC transporter ATP-binding protein/permease [Oscillospiraceae bacterium]
MTFKDVLKMLNPYRRRVACIMLLAIAISAISAITPFISRSMVDEGLLQGDVKYVTVAAIAIAALMVGGQAIEYLQRKQEISISNELGKKLKVDAFEHGLKLKPSYYKEHGFYKIISDALYDIAVILQIANSSFLTIFVVICKCLGALIGLIILDWRLSIFVAALLPIKMLVNTSIRKRAEKQGRQLMEDNKGYNAWLSNILAGIIDIKLWNLRGKILAEYSGHIQTINESSKRHSLLMSLNGLIVVGFEYVWMNALYILGASLIVGQRLTVGGLFAFITFAAYVLSPVNIIMELRVILKQIAPSVEGFRKFNELEEEDGGAALPMPAVASSIEFRDVSVNLGGQDVLSGASFIVRRGEKVAIMGDNGSGKTTLMNLLLRLAEPDSGEILIDGVPISSYSIDEYRLRFSTVCQDIHLFKGTVAENVTIGGSTDDMGNAAFPGGGLPRFCTEAIVALEKRYETQVGSAGTQVSGGERQKIALLRALHRKADVLVLDEPTSHYDGESDDGFDRFIKADTSYGFYFIVSHRRSIIPYVDRVLEVKDGKVTEVIGGAIKRLQIEDRHEKEEARRRL